MDDSRQGRLLVVEDNPAQRYAVTRQLRLAGYTVAEAWNAEQALRLAPEVDLVLLDVVLPGTSGLDVCRHLRAQEATAHLPVILMSGAYPGDLDVEAGLDAGSVRYLLKPVDAEALLEAIREELPVAATARSLLRR